ncbi:MAG TPA: Ig-like domain-containing protein, partial [Myxococcaceae bacterium]|nr:Ig-like domain-containing protein [Myxococcaceae bacterium]
MTQIRFTLLAACVTALVACNDGFSDEVKSGSDYDETESVEMRNPLVIAASARDISPALRDIPPVAPATTQRVHAIERVPRPTTRQAQALQRDPTLQASVGTLAMPTTVFNRDGLGQGFSGPQGTFSVASAPPDTVGDVGLNHYVQAVNSSFAIFNKSGTVVYGPAALNTLWSGFGGGCQTNNDGDPTIRYDKQADRWVISQFSVSTTPYTQCIAVSQTSDPTGAYYRYAFQYGTGFNDYPKMSVWPDGYYISYNMFTNGQTWAGAKVCAMDRAKMLTGAAATQQCFNTSTTYGGLLPSDLDGSTLPPAGSPNYVFGIGATSTTLAMWKFKVDWTTPSNSTFTGPTNITVASYSELCGGGTCITQPGTTQKLDSLADRLMNRVPYRNFGTHQSVLVAHAVTAGTSGGMRWYEIRNPNAPTVHQQGTYAPDSAYRFMGSIAFDKDGNIGMGYNISSSTINPGVRYTGRLVSDALGTMGQGEASIIEGGGAQQTNLSRFGDYSSLNIDPADDCTFWYTTEYIGANGTFNWKTRIASFKFPGCGSAPTDTTPPTTSITAPAAGATVTGSVTLSASASDNVGVSKVEFYVGSSLVGTATAAPYSVSWNSGSVANGSYAITSKAFDAAGNTGTSAAVSVTVSNTTADTTAPTTSITAPAAGATLTGTVTLSASASDNVGVSKVEFYVGSSLVGTATSAP